MRTRIIDAMERLQRCVPAFALAFIASIGATRAKADTTSLTCKTYLSGMSDTPVDAHSAMVKHHDTAARICRTEAGSIEKYYSLSRTWIDRFGVCQFRETERDVASSLTKNAPLTYMLLLKSKSCPERSDPRYISAEGVSGGVFAALVRFWDGLGSSKTDFESATSALAHEDRQGPVFKAVENAFLVQKPSLRLQRIALIPEFQNLPTVGYQLQGRPKNARSITLYVDLTKDGFRVFRIGLTAQ